MEQRNQITRRRFSVEEKRELLRAWRQSRMSALAFARQKGMAASNLWRWSSGLAAADRQKSSKRDVPKPSAFAAIEVVEQKSRFHHTRVPVCELVQPSGAVMRIFAEADEQMVRMALSMWLGGASC